MESDFIANERLWEFLGENGLSLNICKAANNEWHATLYHERDGSVWIKDGDVMCGVFGSGKTPICAFDDMLKAYSGKVLRFEHWENKEYKPIDI